MLRRNVHLEEHDPEAQVDLKTLRESGITASFFAAYVPPFYAGRGARQFAHRVIDLIEAEVARNAKVLTRCDDSAGIRAAKRDGKTAIMIGVEGGHAIEDSLITLRELYRRGARYMTLTHVNTNNWCDSSGDGGRHGGLTDFGREVVRAMNDLGMMVGIGSDFDGVPALPEGLQTASSMPRVTARLLERGLSEGDVEKILGGNFMRVFEQVEGGAV